MKAYWALLAGLLVALAGGVGFHLLAEDAGYVLISFAGWSLETSLVVALLLLLFGWLLLRWLWLVLRAPLHWWRQRRRQKARERLAGGYLALLEGRWAQAEKLLQRAAQEPSQRQAALLGAAQAALARGEHDRGNRHLGQAAAAGATAACAVVNAGRLLAAGTPAAAAELLEASARERPLPPRGLELQILALIDAGRGAEALALRGRLRHSGVVVGEPLAALEARVAAAALSQASSADELERLWQQLDRRERVAASVTQAYARAALRFGAAGAAASAIERALDKQWDDALAADYGQLVAAPLAPAIRIAEGWLQQHPDSAGALLALGRLCRRERLWGKSEQFLLRALPGHPAAAWEALAELFVDRGDEARARQALFNALRAARGEDTTPLRSITATVAETAVPELRNAMGLPQLPSS